MSFGARIRPNQWSLGGSPTLGDNDMRETPGFSAKLLDACDSPAGWALGGDPGSFTLLEGQGPNGGNALRVTATNLNGYPEIHKTFATPQAKTKHGIWGVWLRFPNRAKANMADLIAVNADAVGYYRNPINIDMLATSRVFTQDNDWFLYTFPDAGWNPYGGAAAMGSNTSGIATLKIGIYSALAAGASVDFGGIYYGMQNDIATLAFGFDDAFATDLTEAADYLAKYNFVGNQYTIANRWGTGAGEYCTLDQVKRLQNEYGWLICTHSDNRIDQKTVAQAQAIMQVELSKMQAAGFNRGLYHYAYVGGYFDPNAIAALANMGFKTARTGGPVYRPFNMANQKHLLLGGAANVQDFADLAAAKAFVDEVVATRSHAQLFHHTFTGYASRLTLWKGLVDYVATLRDSGKVVVDDMENLYQRAAQLSLS